ILTPVLKFLKYAISLQPCVLVILACLFSFDLSAQSYPGFRKQYYKMAPGLEQIQQQNKTATTVRVQVKDRATFTKWLHDNQVKAATTPASEKNNLVTISNVDAGKLEKLLQNPYTEFRDKPTRKAQVE